MPDDYTVNTQNAIATTGNIAAAQAAGFPPALLLPVCPPTASGMPPTALGKAPAVIRADRTWSGLKSWTSGTSAVVREACDLAGANCGLVLGLQNNLQQFVAVDCDMAVEPPADLSLALTIREVILKTIVANVGNVWVRNTRPGRAAVLLRLPPEQAAGSKAIIHLNNDAAGRVELLSKLQQIVIAGRHPTGLDVEWYRTDAPGELFQAPQVDDAIPILKSRATVDTLLERISEALVAIGVDCTATKTHDPDTANSNHTSPADKAAPSIAALLELLQGLPNPASAGRGVYLAVGHGTAACIQAARALQPPITPDEETAVIKAWADWAARWESPTSSSQAVEEAKLRSDWMKRPDIYAGWRTLVATASDLGWDGGVAIDAGAYFDASEMTAEEEAAETEKAEEAARNPSMRQRMLAPGDCSAASAIGDYIIKRMLVRGNVACFFGHPGSGKSVIAPHIGYAVAQGKQVFGMKTKACDVLYATAEDYDGMKKRVDALFRKHGDAPFKLVDIGSLIDEKEAAEFVALAADFGLVIIDTLAAAWAGFKENESEGMGMVMALARKIAKSGAAVILIHHPAKGSDETPRGHGSFNGTLEFSMYIPPTPADGIIRGAVRKNKNGPLNLDIAFSVKVADLGLDVEGDAVTAPIVGEVSGQPTAQPAAQPAVRLKGTKELAMLALRECLAASGVVQLSGGMPACTVEDWRESFYAKKGAMTTQDAKKKAFLRVQDDLQGMGLIEVRDVLVWEKGKAKPGAATATEEFAPFEVLPPIQPGELEELLG